MLIAGGKSHHFDDPAHLSPNPLHQSLNHMPFPECAQVAHASCARDGPKPQLPLFPVAACQAGQQLTTGLHRCRCHPATGTRTMRPCCNLVMLPLLLLLSPLLLSTSIRPTKNTGPVPPPRQLQCDLLSLPLFPPLLSSTPSMPTTNAGPAPLPLDDAAFTSR